MKRTKPKHPKAPWYRAKYPNGEPPKKRKRVRAESTKRRRDRVEYNRLAAGFLTHRPVCEVCARERIVTRRQSTQVHHTCGRKGTNYLDQKTWMAVCAECHDTIHRNPKWAMDRGYLRSFIA
jgi:hypothetical protein